MKITRPTKHLQKKAESGKFPLWRGVWLRIGIALYIGDYNQHMGRASADQLRSYHDNLSRASSGSPGNMPRGAAAGPRAASVLGRAAAELRVGSSRAGV